MNQVSNDIRYNSDSKVAIGLGVAGVGVFVWGVISTTAFATPIGGVISVSGLLLSVSADIQQNKRYDVEDDFTEILEFIDDENNNGKYIEITKRYNAAGGRSDTIVTVNTYPLNYIEKSWINTPSGNAYFGEFGIDNYYVMNEFFNISIDGYHILD